MQISNRYVHIQCDRFALLLDIRWVEEVIDARHDLHQVTDDDGSPVDEILWRGIEIPFLDLTGILLGRGSAQNRHCIITRDGDTVVALGVGQVAQIQAIREEDFEDLPSLDFPFNDYFDKAYMKHKGKHCIYRLRNLVKLWQKNREVGIER